MKKVFKIPEQAFAAMDFGGKGYMVEDDFFHTLLNYKIPYKEEEVREYFKYEKMFIRLPEGRMDFEAFKKAFFPKRFEGEDDNIKEEEFKLEKNLDENSKSEILIDRMLKIEKLLKDKFSNNFISIRKAFLNLDTDYDGFITAEDIARQFGKGNQKLDFRDLRTLIVNRDSKRIGRINFKDFCKWMGGVIEPTETFYFRHDSLRNPTYEESRKNDNAKHAKSKKVVSDAIMNSNLMKRIMDKIQTQWKTLKKAFSDLNQSKNGWIEKQDLKRYLTNWGLDITEEQFEDLYAFLDHDKDGHITYEDFKQSVGSIISPVEFLYFRQDIPPQRLVTCQHHNCWEATKGAGKYWFLHKKIVRDRSLQLLGKFQKSMKKDRWSSFLKELTQNCSDKKRLITKEKFLFLLERYNLFLDQMQKDDLLEFLSLKDEGINNEIDITPIWVELKQCKDINNVYTKIDLEKREDDQEMQNIHYKLQSISEKNFLYIISENTSFKELMREIKKCDLDSNGYLTLDELNIVFWQVYPKLEGRSMFKIFRPFGSIQNKSLINYKKWIAYIKAKLEKLPAKGEVKEIINEKLPDLEADHHEKLLTKDETEEIINKRLFSPNTKRMDNMKNNFLKAVKLHQGVEEIDLKDQKLSNDIIPNIDLKGKTHLEALLSPERNLPKLTLSNLK